MNAPVQTKRLHGSQFTLLGLFIFTTIAGCGACVVRTLTYHVERHGISSTEANRALHRGFSPAFVPTSAANVDVYVRFNSGWASFDISESDFLEWARLRDFAVTRQQSNTGLDFGGIGIQPEFPSDTKDAWYFRSVPHPRGSGWKVMYDRNRGRGYVDFAKR